MFSPEFAAECRHVPAGLVWLAVHLAVHEIFIFHDNSKFAVVESELRLQLLASCTNNFS